MATERWTIIAIEPIKPAGVVIGYRILVRK